MSESKRKVGRPAQGITKKVSITLTESEWAEIPGNTTVAAYIKHMQEQVRLLQSENERLSSMERRDALEQGTEERLLRRIKRLEKSGQELVNEKIRLQQEVEILSGKLAKRIM